MYIYKITNNLNGKVYIGKTTKSVEIRYNQHLKASEIYAQGHRNLSLLYEAINKYGKYNFSVEMIDTASTIEELNKKEIYWIKFYRDSFGKEFCYNMTSGGDGGDTNSGKTQSEEWITKRLASRKTYAVSDETREKQRLARLNRVPWNKGKKMSVEYCEKCRERSKGNTNHLGHKATEIQRKHMSESHKGQIPWNKGLKGCVTQSEETKKKRADKLRGTIGINDGTKNTRVSKEHLDEYLNAGWSIGWLKKDYK